MSKATAARASRPTACAGCEARAGEIQFLRARVEHLEGVLVAGSPQGPAVAQQQQEAAGVKITPETFIDVEGQAMVLLDGKQVPWTEWRRGEDALQAALAGKCVEIPDPTREGVT